MDECATFPILPKRELSTADRCDDQCHIASMILYCKPEFLSATTAACEAMENSTVYQEGRDSAFVLVVERVGESALRETIDQLNALDGVVNVSLVYHHCDSNQSLSEELVS